MEQAEHKLITVSPQIHSKTSTSKIMWTVVLCLAPAGIWGAGVFGYRTLAVMAVSIIAALLGELLAGFFMKKFTILDGSAFLTGLLIAYNVPAAVPLYVPAVASLFAILVVKWSFGGLGANWMNPALAGRVFVFFSWTGGMTKWTLPNTVTGGIDGVSGASPLGHIKAGILDFSGRASSSIDFLNQTGYESSRMGQVVSGWFETNLGWSTDPISWDLFLGNIPGCIGEVSAVLLLLGAVYLFIRKIITWEIPLAYLGIYTILIWIFGGLRFGNGFFSGDIIFHLFTGGLMLGVFYMATDMVTSPLTRKGMLIFGAGCGFLTFLIRIYGSFPEGVSLAIILMNIFVPMINRYTGPSRFGIVKTGEDK
ncbi:MAG: RnfABCDGE type electron transport complex subunit D [Spirochaetales bacterium]|nr:RnfABCDGE type electron transport complex subunit D [Spirochaetales bacterium]